MELVLEEWATCWDWMTVSRMDGSTVESTVVKRVLRMEPRTENELWDRR
jgi:hypothetical protein